MSHTPEQKRLYDKRRRQILEVKKREQKARKEWYEKGGRETVKKTVAKWRSRTKYPGWRDPIRRRARNLAQAAIRRGKIKRTPCEACGDPRSEAHHDDYSQPLTVRFLCNKHHREAHQAIRIRALPDTAAEETKP
jgi:hypothetical protein